MDGEVCKVGMKNGKVLMDNLCTKKAKEGKPIAEHVEGQYD